MTFSPWVPSPGSPLLWLHGRCSGQQSFHFCGYRRISQCSGLRGGGQNDARFKHSANTWYLHFSLLQLFRQFRTLTNRVLPDLWNSTYKRIHNLQTTSPPTLGEDGGLPCELLQHFSSSGQPVSALADADVQAELADAELSHGVLLLLTLVLENRKQIWLLQHRNWH